MKCARLRISIHHTLSLLQPPHNGPARRTLIHSPSKYSPVFIVPPAHTTFFCSTSLLTCSSFVRLHKKKIYSCVRTGTRVSYRITYKCMILTWYCLLLDIFKNKYVLASFVRMRLYKMDVLTLF